jgi:hypothetical protein
VADRESQIAPHFIIANGGVVTEIMPDGSKLFVAHQNNNALEAMTFLARLAANDLFVLDVDNHTAWMAGGEAMFQSGSYQNLRQFTRPVPPTPPTDFVFGLLPIPKGDNMDDYVAPTHAADMWYILEDIPRPEEIAAILVAVANRTAKINIIQTELNFGVTDTESAEILEFLLERVVVDYSRLSAARNRIGEAVNMILRGEAGPRQAFEQFAQEIQDNYESLRPRE